jgi:hypothetical protein
MISPLSIIVLGFFLGTRHATAPDHVIAVTTIVHDDLFFGFSRMFGMLREDAGETGIRIFRNLDDALDWILDRKAPH